MESESCRASDTDAIWALWTSEHQPDEAKQSDASLNELKVGAIEPNRGIKNPPV